MNMPHRHPYAQPEGYQRDTPAKEGHRVGVFYRSKMGKLVFFMVPKELTQNGDLEDVLKSQEAAPENPTTAEEVAQKARLSDQKSRILYEMVQGALKEQRAMGYVGANGYDQSHYDQSQVVLDSIERLRRPRRSRRSPIQQPEARRA